MTRKFPRRQRPARQPVSVPMTPEEIATLDQAAALKDPSRASYARRVLLREANADIREAERKAQQSNAA